MNCRNEGIPPDQQILAGPIARRCDRKQLVFWLCSREALRWRIATGSSDQEMVVAGPDTLNSETVQVGKHCFIHLITFSPSYKLPKDEFIYYDLQWQPASTRSKWYSMRQWAPKLGLNGAALPRLSLRSRVDNMLHGSCRKPHHNSEDGLVAANTWLSDRGDKAETWPAMLMMSGDQVYTDDVAGPMLTAIHQLIDELGLFPEQIEGAEVSDSRSLFDSEFNYYRRHELLPDTKGGDTLQQRFFEGARKPIFTSANADNHLVTLAEMFAMYLLVWSPVPWSNLEEGEPELDEEMRTRYQRERDHLERFRSGLWDVRQLLAHLPTMMIFDDHDVTDDWNLTADWEKTAYGHPFSRRIIGNAMLAYALCQAWGNTPDMFDDSIMSLIKSWSEAPEGDAQDLVIDELMRFDSWHYSLDTEPKVLVMDTRTRRWRSESNLKKPSGLLDWEALSELQNELLDQESVILISPAPIFGVKLIEAVQKIFTYCGKPLLVDAENWMAHKGTANVILNIFGHTKTPKHFVILSGDVHYSFVYGIRLRSENSGSTPHLWQITSSGMKNSFPTRLLDTLDRLNRWLFSPRSPLNWLTQRRRLEIIPYRHSAASRGERLLNRSGVGYVEFDNDGKPTHVEQISQYGNATFDVDK